MGTECGTCGESKGWSELDETEDGHICHSCQKDEVIAKLQGPGWLLYSSAPKEGAFLVYMPEEPEGREIQVMTRWRANGQTHEIIGGNWAYDLTKPYEWHPLPERDE